MAAKNGLSFKSYHLSTDTPTKWFQTCHPLFTWFKKWSVCVSQGIIARPSINVESLMFRRLAAGVLNR